MKKLVIIPAFNESGSIVDTVEDIRKNAPEFDYIVMAQSPNYTPASADFIMDIVREYIDEC